jgi:hypothetical protein
MTEDAPYPLTPAQRRYVAGFREMKYRGKQLQPVTSHDNVRKPGDAPMLDLSGLVPLLQATRNCSALALAVAARVATATWARHASEPGMMTVKRWGREPRLRDCTFVTPL